MIDVRFPDGHSERWNQTDYDQYKDDLYKEYQDAKVTRYTPYNPENDTDASNSDQFQISFSDGHSEVWGRKDFDTYKGDLMKVDPNAQILKASDMSLQYWGSKAEESGARLNELRENNKDFIRQYEQSERLADALTQDGVKNSDYHDFVTSNKEKYDDLVSRREDLRRQYYTNPLVVKAFQDNAAAAVKTRDEYDSKAAAAATGDERRDWKRAAKLQDDIRKLYEAPSKYSDELDSNNGFIDYIKDYSAGAVDTFSDKDFYTLGLSKIARNFDLRGIAEKLQGAATANGQVTAEDIDRILTPGEKAEIQSFYQLAAAQEQRADNISSAYNAGGSFAESVKFMAEFLASQGLANVAGKAMSASSNALASWLGRQLMSERALNSAISKGVTAATKGTKAALFAEDYLARPVIQGLFHTATQLSSLEGIADGLLDTDSNGKLVSVGQAVSKGILDQVVENWSESFGGAIEKTLALPFKGLGWAGERTIANTGFGRWARWIYNSDPVQLFKEAGFNGMISEIGEEWAGNAVRVGLGLMSKDEFKDFASWEKQLEMAASFAPLSIIGLGTSTTAAVRRSGRLKSLSGQVQGILEKQGRSQEEIDDLFNTRFDTAEDVAKKLAPYLKGISEKAAAKGATEQDKADYKTVMEFAQELSVQGIAEEMENLRQADRRKELKDNIESSIGTFWRDTEETGEDGNPVRTQTVRVVTDVDGASYYVTGEDEQGLVGISTANGKKRFINPKDIESDTTSSLEEYLQGRVDAMDSDAEARRMEADRQEQIAAVQAAVAANPVIPIGTPEAPMNATVVAANNTGVQIAWEEEGQQKTDTLSWGQVAANLGTPIVVKTDAELEADAADELDAARGRMETYRRITPGTDMTVMLPTGEGDQTEPVTYKFEKAVLEDGRVMFYGQDEQGKSTAFTEEMIGNLDELVGSAAEETTPFKSGESVTYTDDSGNKVTGTVSSEDNGGGYTSVVLPDGSTSNVQTARLSESEGESEEKTPAVAKYTDESGKVNQNAFITNEPEEWAKWNDEQNQDGGADSQEALTAAISELDASLKEEEARRKSTSNPDERSTIKENIANLSARRERLQAIIDGYSAKEEAMEAAGTPVVEETPAPVAETAETAPARTEVNPEQAEAARIQALKDRVRAWEERTGVTIDAIESRDQVTNEQAARAIDEGKPVTGWFEPGTGRVVIYLPNIVDEAEIDRTYMHEVVSHKGLKDLLGEQGWNALMDSVWNNIMTDKDKTDYLAYNSHLRGSEEFLRRAAADEYVAHLAESVNTENAGTWQKFVEMVKEILLKLGMDVKITNEDLGNLLQASLANYERIQAERRAEAIAQQEASAPANGYSQKISDILSGKDKTNHKRHFTDNVSYPDEAYDEVVRQWDEYKKSVEEQVRPIQKKITDLVDRLTQEARADIERRAAEQGRTIAGASLQNAITDELDNALKNNGEYQELVAQADALNDLISPEAKDNFRQNAIGMLKEEYGGDATGFVKEGDKLTSYIDAPTGQKSPSAPDETMFSLKREEDSKDDEGKTVPGLRTLADGFLAKLTEKPLTPEELAIGSDAIKEMVDYMMPYLDMVKDGKRYLPEEIFGKGWSTIFKNGSYGRTMENTLICMRTLAYNDFVNAVQEKVGRPLTPTESFLASQMLYDIATDPQCLYCYVALDRKAYNGFLKTYIEQRDAVLDKYKADDSIDKTYRLPAQAKSRKNRKALPADNKVNKLYLEYLDGRADTPSMRNRFNGWLDRIAEGTLIGMKDLTSPETRQKVAGKGASYAAQIDDAEKYAQSASWAKKQEEYRAYNGELLSMPQKVVNLLNSEYGLRFYSFSEYSPAFIVENMQMVRDAALRGLVGLAYTKEIDFAKIFAPTGININISCYGREAEDGTVVMDTKQGADWGEAQALREKYGNVGCVFVATNDRMVEWALHQPWVDVIIPFHIVRTGEDIAKFYDWTNYTSMESDKDVKGRSMDIMPTEHMNDKDTFLQLCEERGLKPRFADLILPSTGRSVTEDPDYMKLVNETRRSVNETVRIKPIFDTQEAKRSFDEFVDKGGYYAGWFTEEGAFERGVERVAADVEAGKTAKDVDYGRQDIKASAEKLAAMAGKKKRPRSHQGTPRRIGGDKITKAQQNVLNYLETGEFKSEREPLEVANATQKQPVSDAAQPVVTEEDVMDVAMFRLSKNNRQTVESWIGKREDLTEEQRREVVDYIDKLDDAKTQLATARWFANGTIRIPEDMKKVQQAISVAGKAKVDPLKYKSPMELLDAHAEFKPSEERINPDEVSTLHRAAEYPEGIVVYDVDDTEESRKNMRKIINSHFGEDASPWCLLQGDGKGNLTADSKKYWRHYNAYPKQVAFKDGKLLAFSANDRATRLWWDRKDESHYGIPITQKVEGDELGRSASHIIGEDGQLVKEPGAHLYKGNTQNGLYEEWSADGDQILERTNYKDGKEDGLGEYWYPNGQMHVRRTIKEDIYVGSYETWYDNGNRKASVNLDDEGLNHGTRTIWWRNGNKREEETFDHGKHVSGRMFWDEDGDLVEIDRYDESGDVVSREEYNRFGIESRRTYVGEDGQVLEKFSRGGRLLSVERTEKGRLNGLQEQYALDGTLLSRVEYKNGERDGIFEKYHPDGKIWIRGQYKDGKKEGVHESWSRDGVLNTRTVFKDDEVAEVSPLDGLRFRKAFDSANEELEGERVSVDNPDLMREYGLSNVTMTKKGDLVTLNKVVVAEKKKGNGTRFMNDLTSEADNNGWTLALTPDDSFGATSVGRLKKFYKRFGFKENKGRNADLTINESMIRQPEAPRFRLSNREQMDQDYMAAVEAGDMDTAQRMVDDMAEAAGYTIRGYHGTTHDFTVFDRSKGNAEGNWGKGFYFTNNEDDAEANYAGEGPDLTNRIEHLAENMEWMDGYEDMSYEERFEEARKQLAGDNPHTISAAIKMENPVVFDSHYRSDETFFDYNSGYNEETDEYEEEPSGKLVDFVEAWNDVLYDFDYQNVSPDSILEYADYDGLTASQLENKAREILDSVGGIMTVDGEYASGEFLRQVFERMGFDGIVDNNVNIKFGTQRKYGRSMDGMDYGTTHVIAFKPNQIKQTDPVTYDDEGKVIPLSKRFDLSNDDIRFRKVYHGSGADFEKFDHSHMGEGEGNQAYGWGTYVTTNEDTGRHYAEAYGEEGNRHLYTVDIPDDNGENYLHWDRPITMRQSRKIMDAVRELADKESFGDEFENELKGALGYGTYGRHVEGGLNYMLGNMMNYTTGVDEGAERNAKVLNSAGIVGIEIPIDRQGGQRYNGSNFVIFNEDDLDITEHIRFRKANQTQNGFISNAEAALDRIKMDKATPEQWMKMLEKEGGLKAGEDKWLGLSDWLKESDKKTLTKDEVGDFIAENRIQIEEVRYGGETPEIDMKVVHPNWDDAFHPEQDEFHNSLYWEVDDPAIAQEIYEEVTGESLVDEDGELVSEAFGILSNFAQTQWEKEAAKTQQRVINSTRLHYTTDGLKNYREIALTVPTIEPWNESDEIHFGDAGEGRAVAWTRFGDASDAEGNKVLVIDEIQSNRHQEGREKGYNTPYREAVKELEENKRRQKELMSPEDFRLLSGFGLIKEDNSELIETPDWVSSLPEETQEKIKEVSSRYMEWVEEVRKEPSLRAKVNETEVYKKGAPAAPFEKNWHELAMKRMLRLAAEEGYDKIAWTTGDQQAERYNIGGVLNSIERRDSYNLHEKEFTLNLNTSGTQYITTDEEGNVINTIVEDYRGKTLSDLVGKELAIRMLSMNEGDTIQGDGLRVGGEGMKGFYDDILPRFMNKYGKKWGVKVGTVELQHVYDELGHPLVMHSVDVTPEMRESVMEGQVMFRKTAPNGKPSNLTDEQWETVRTPEFKAWFGDWEKDPENSSKVVDENGEPLVVYHGTSLFGFTKFKKPGENGSGLIWLTDDRRYAESYQTGWYDKDGVYRLFANVKNPLNIGYIEDVIGSEDWDKLAALFNLTPEELFDRLTVDSRKRKAVGTNYEIGVKSLHRIFEYTNNPEFVELLKERGYDGAIAYEDGINRIPTIGVVSNTQIKSAEPVTYDNNGEVIPLSERFNPDNEDIRFSLRGIIGAENAEDEAALDNLEVAEDMEKAGKDSQTIWEATGWERGADGKWRNEIPDAKQREGVSLKKTNVAGEVIDAPELFASYPGLKAITIDLVKSASAGAFNKDEKRITLDKDYNTRKEDGRTVLNENGIQTILHELQHAIQETEGFARGGNNKEMERQFYKDSMKAQPDETLFAWLVSRFQGSRMIMLMGRRRIIDAMEKYDDSKLNLSEKKTFRNILDRLMGMDETQFKSFVLDASQIVKKAKKAGNVGYNNLAGEVEARNVERRSRILPEKDRKNYPPEITEDVSRSEQIIRFRKRTKEDPKETIKVYKLMRLEDGKKLPLFIDRNSEPLEDGQWYDADSPDLAFLKDMPSGIFLVDTDKGTYTSLEDYQKERGAKATKWPTVDDVNEASSKGLRWMKITDTGKAQRRYEGENRKYENIGINGSEGVSTFAMRPGWHAGSLPTMRQIGKGAEKNIRDDRFVWVEGEIPADIDYNEEAQRNPDKDIPTHIPTDGYYLKATNADKAKSQADRVGWYVAGAFKPNRVIGDLEARQIIDDWNAEHPDAKVEYDWPREGGRVFNAETMRLEEPETEETIRFRKSQDMVRQSRESGLAGMIGDEDTTELYLNVYRAVPKEIRDRIISRAGDSYIFSDATKDIISEAVEKGDETGIAGLAANMLRDYLGDLDERTARYILWRGTRKAADDDLIDTVNDIAMQRRLQVGEFAERPLFRMSPVTEEEDRAFREAEKRGDKEAAARLVEEAARKSGYNTPKLYHGTDAFGFTSISNKAADDGLSFWATNNEEVAGSYTKLAITRRPGTEIDSEEYDRAYEKADTALDEEISNFRRLIDKYFSEWYFGQSGNSGIRKKIMDANHERGYGDGVYDVLEDYVVEAYAAYGEDYEGYEDFADWEENSPEAQKIFDSISSLEGLREQLWQLENGELSGGIYELYANTDNMFVVDAKGKVWDGLHPEGLPKIERGQYKDVPYTTREVVKWAKENGYDGVIFKNIRDNGQYGHTEPSDVYAFLKPQAQVKSAEPFTYDDEGKLIPLSERFNSDNEDIRFRLSDNIEEHQNRADSMADDAKETLDDKKAVARWNDALTTVKAMSLQKEYDRKTVNTITVLAKNIIKDQDIDTLNRREIARLLGIVTTSVGKAPKTVKKNADALMGLVIDHLLRSEETKLGMLVSRKASKTNATGVEVQGELDVRGQNVLKAYKAGLDMNIDNPDDESDENTINGRLAVLTERLSGNDDALRSEAEDEYAGLMLAKEYQENIKASVNEERGIRNEIKAAEEALHAGRMSRKDFNEFMEEANNSIRENKVERVEAYRDLQGRLRNMMTGSIEARKAFTEREKARVDEIHHLANSDMQGRDASPFRESTRMGRLANSSIVRFFSKPLVTFDQMLRLFGAKNVAGEGYLWNKFHRGWIDASENAYLGEREAKSELDAKVSEVFGKEMRWSDLYSVERKMPTVKVKWWDGGEMREHELTQGNLLYIYMVNKMTDGRMKLRRMGITQDIVDRIARQMDERFIDLADWLQGEYLVQKRNKYNAVHERLFGASMAAIEDYFPLKINKRSLNKDEDIGRPEFDDALPATTTGSIIKRKRNAQDLDLAGADAFSVVIEHVEQMERWAAFAEFNKDLNTLLSYKRFRNQVQNMESVYGSGRELWNNFKSVCRIAGGTYNPAGKKSDLDTAALNMAKGVTAAKISFRVYTALKQFLSAPAFVADANIKYLAGNMATPWKAWNWAMENLPMFEKRWRSRMAGDTRLMKTESDWKFYQGQIYDTLSRLGMSPNAFVDALTVSIGSHSIYQTRYDRYIRDGYTEEQADKKAKQDATTLYNETQQSNEAAFVAPVQLDRTVLSTMLTVFRNSSMGYQRQLHDAIRNIGKMLGKGYKAASIEFMTKQMTRDGLTEEQAEHAANRSYNREIWRSAARVATFGFLVQFAWNLGGSIAYLLFGDDDDKKEEMLKEAALHGLIGGSMEGLAGGNVMSGALNMVAKGESLNNYDPSLLPIVSDIKSAYKKMSYDPVAGANDLINLAIQAGVGVNPQTLTDAVVAVVDACGGDLDTSKEAMLLIMRVLQVPQSQVDQIYIDELGMTAKKARSLGYNGMAERYARYKVNKGAPITGWAYSDEAEEKREKAYLKRFKKLVNERKDSK